MALSFSITDQTVVGDQRRVVATVTFDSSYPTGGEAVTPSNFGLQSIRNVEPAVPVAGSRLVAWDGTNSKLKVFTAIGTEAADTSDQSTIIAPVVVYGK